ncbi:hypothetical protein [Bacillus thuringiensis]|uniref:hypothetical protein n=1 Tax=Bacillus thuringiensis TaxID=1428 RepID=UPI000CD851A0|nr:hypothetical protein [Bacillus thuringiensis]
MPKIQSATRSIPKSTYAPLILEMEIFPPDGRAILKFNYVQNLALQPGEVDNVRKELTTISDREDEQRIGLLKDSSIWNTLQSFEGRPMPSLLPSPAKLAPIPTSILLDFGKAVVASRKRALEKISQPVSDDISNSVTTTSDVARAMNFVNSAVRALNGFESNVTVHPIGMLNLEMTPAGIEKGELLATIPLAPGEQTSVVQKEWSVTSKEFTSIVTDSLENYSEKGVTEKNDLSQSTTSQTEHSNQFNVNASVSGSSGFVTGSVATTFGTQDKHSTTAKDSIQHSVATTRKASSRVKQEHKVTISTTTVTGKEETTTRTLRNPSDTTPMRIDYFSMMRKWHVGLYRYGLRLTYDIAIPEPGAALREAHAKLADLKSQLSKPFEFHIHHVDITEDIWSWANEYQSHYLVLAEQYNTEVPSPPGPLGDIYVSANPKNTDDHNSSYNCQMTLQIPEGYWTTKLYWSGSFQTHTGAGGGMVEVLGCPGFQQPSQPQDFGNWVNVPLPDNFMVHAAGEVVLSCRLDSTTQAWIQFQAKIAPTDDAMTKWRNDVWNALYNAAQTQFYAEQQRIASQISELEDKIQNVDTLTLRREEHDEIMKGVLRWILGPTFDFMPPDVINLFFEQGNSWSLEHGVNFTGNFSGLTQPTDWSTMYYYQEMVKFINEAVEWENVQYFLYSYFWDVPYSWDFIRNIQHPDATRQAFLRSGSARVVLPIRKGWEKKWIAFTEHGDLGSDQSILYHPYMTIAQEIAAYDETNYPGIPPANSSGTQLLSQFATTTCSDKVTASTSPVTLKVESNAGFAVGSVVVIDTYDTKDTNIKDPLGNYVSAQESQVITAISDDEQHITVKKLDHPHDGTTTPFTITIPGEKGVLIAEWYEYTPTSGTDIAVTSDLDTIG